MQFDLLDSLRKSKIVMEEMDGANFEWKTVKTVTNAEQNSSQLSLTLVL